jgi:hypothetical protein
VWYSEQLGDYTSLRTASENRQRLSSAQDPECQTLLLELLRQLSDLSLALRAPSIQGLEYLVRMIHFELAHCLPQRGPSDDRQVPL